MGRLKLDDRGLGYFFNFSIGIPSMGLWCKSVCARPWDHWRYQREAMRSMSELPNRGPMSPFKHRLLNYTYQGSMQQQKASCRHYKWPAFKDSDVCAIYWVACIIFRWEYIHLSKIPPVQCQQSWVVALLWLSPRPRKYQCYMVRKSTVRKDAANIGFFFPCEGSPKFFTVAYQPWYNTSIFQGGCGCYCLLLEDFTYPTRYSGLLNSGH